MPRDGTLHEPAAVSVIEPPLTDKTTKKGWFRAKNKKAAAPENAPERTPFDEPIGNAAAHLGCLTLHAQLTDGEQEDVCRYVAHHTHHHPGQFSVTDRTETTTTVRWNLGPGLGLSLCLTNDGKKLMVTEPVHTRPFDAGYTVKIVEALHAWRHAHGSPESRAIDQVLKGADKIFV